MNRRTFAGICLSWPVLGWAHEAAQKAPDPTDVIFDPKTPLLRVSVAIDELNLKLLQQDPRRYVKITLTLGDKTFNEVGMHLKGAAGSFRGWDDKPALTLNTDKFVPNQSYFGLDKFHLNNSVQDGTYLNELVCSQLARSMGVPTARTTHAFVELNKRPSRMYVLKEGYNKGWLKRNFEKASGRLYDGGFLRDIDQNLELDVGNKTDWKDLKTLTAACHIGDPRKRYEAVEKLVDVDLFVKNAALQIVGTDWDGYIRNRNNYRVYFRPTDGKAVFIPHGMDQMFGNLQEGLWHGWGGLAARAILDTPEGKKKTIAALNEMVDKHFTPDYIKGLEVWIKRVVEGLGDANKERAKEFERAAREQQRRLRERYDFVKAELPKLK